MPALIDIPVKASDNGSLGIIEALPLAGFHFERVYYLFGLKADSLRGQHAHKKLKQFMVCLNGSVTVELEGATGKHSYTLNTPAKGLQIEPGYWRDLTNFSSDAVVAVFASEPYDEDDYIRDYDSFRSWLAEQANAPVSYIPMDRCHGELLGKLQAALHDIVKRSIYIGGEPVAKFEHDFAALCGAPYAVSCGNGLDALVMILRALEIGAGDEVIVPANSFIASALAVEAVGATSIFVDCEENGSNLDVSALEQLITPNTKAIMPVHLYGIPADMDVVMSVATKHNLHVIEDAAQAHGATYKGKPVGSFGIAAGFSLYPTKNLGALGDGGVIVTRDEAIAAKVRLIGNYGSVKKYHHEIKGWNSRLDTLQAAFLNIKLRHLADWTTRRQEIARLYQDGLAGVSGLILPDVARGSEAVWHVYPVRVMSGQRDALKQHLEKAGIGTNIHYPLPIHQQTAYTGNKAHCPRAVQQATELLSLPLDPYHRDDEIMRVIAAVKAFFAQAKQTTSAAMEAA
jgi:dTDP-3-amino-3,4,6-trideoxy-alpha-D-glucose transaminase